MHRRNDDYTDFAIFLGKGACIAGYVGCIGFFAWFAIDPYSLHETIKGFWS